MAELDLANATVLDREQDDYSVDTAALDYAGGEDETIYTFSKANEYIGYYKTIPELKKAVDALATWTAGKGFETDIDTKIVLEHVQGWGEDTIESIFENMIVVKKIIGDSFAEIIKDEATDEIINLKPISPERMRIIVDKRGIIKRYEQITQSGGFRKLKPERILHLCNDRVGDEIHGVSVIEAVKWVIDARNEAMTDYRTILHRNVVPVRIIEIDTDDRAKRNKLMAEYKDAIQKGEVLIIPKGTVDIKDNQIKIQDPLAWVQYLENFFYQAVGIPKIILGGSEQFTEASSKVGYLTFEQVYMAEQKKLEADLWNQLAIRVTFNRPVSLKEDIQSNETKNTGQTNFQPKDESVSMGRE